MHLTYRGKDNKRRVMLEVIVPPVHLERDEATGSDLPQGAHHNHQLEREGEGLIKEWQPLWF